MPEFITELHVSVQIKLSDSRTAKPLQCFVCFYKLNASHRDRGGLPNVKQDIVKSPSGISVWMNNLHVRLL